MASKSTSNVEIIIVSIDINYSVTQNMKCYDCFRMERE